MTSIDLSLRPPDRQALARELVDHIEHAELPPVTGAILDKIVGPDMVRVLRSQTDARTVVEPEPSTPRLFLGDLQPLPSPDALDGLRFTTQPACRSSAVIRR